MDKIKNDDYSKMLLELSGAVARIIPEVREEVLVNPGWTKNIFRNALLDRIIKTWTANIHKPTESDIDLILESFFEAGFVSEYSADGEFVTWH